MVTSVGVDNRDDMASFVDGVEAVGETPIGLSLEEASDDLGESGGSVVLVSDGAEECYPDLGPAPCHVAQAIADDGIDLQVHAIGFQTDNAASEQLNRDHRSSRGRRCLSPWFAFGTTAIRNGRVAAGKGAVTS
ncbi:MAG: hypothetical protein KAZ88_00265 [Acidimicrobiia bacterium]|nr:hypothetical protein [Acidimicrobiia bacterium]MBP8179410.1 hypothetical protein [Acidimicrobiia bacterium]